MDNAEETSGTQREAQPSAPYEYPVEWDIRKVGQN